MTVPSVVHHSIAITYSEHKNWWVFTKDGRERHASTLALAKEAIDKPDTEQKKPFNKVECWFEDHGEGYVKVTVTNIADSPAWRSHPEFWIIKGKDRSKRGGNNLYPCNPLNDMLIAQLEDYRKQERELSEKRDKVFEKLKHLTVEP